jgi:hypothetical protein
MRVIVGLALVVAASSEGRAEAPVPWLGITFDAGSQFGARVIDVHPGTAAASAGLQPGDEITTVGNVMILPTTELWPLVSSHRIGTRLPITFVRGGQRYRVAPRLTPRPASDEIVYQRLFDHVMPSLDLVDRQGAGVSSVELRRPLVWLVFDARCDRCSSVATDLTQSTGDGSDTDAGLGAALRVVVVGAREEIDAYLARAPVAATVWRIDRGDPKSLGVDAGRRLLSGLDARVDGAVLVTTHTGEVTFATSLSAGEAVRDGARVAISRAVTDWSRSR